MLTDIVIVVVNDVTNSDITLLNNVNHARKLDDEARARVSGHRSKDSLPIFVIHNLRDVLTFEELCIKWLVSYLQKLPVFEHAFVLCVCLRKSACLRV